MGYFEEAASGVTQCPILMLDPLILQLQDDLQTLFAGILCADRHAVFIMCEETLS